MRRKHREEKGDCIDPKNVPCEKARAYLAKHGRLCGVKKPVDHPRRSTKSAVDRWFTEWFG
jgi:hypothetical protein